MLTPEKKRDLLYSALRIRLFEERICDVYGKQDMKTPVHLYIGQEAIGSGISASLVKEDMVFTTHRCHGHYLAKGGDMKRMVAEFYGKATGCSGGKGGSMHLIDLEVGIPGTTAIVGGGIPQAVGAALALKMKKTGNVSVLYFGDGAADEGVLQESLNFAGLHRLPVIFMCENNFFATNSFQMKRQPVDMIWKRGECFSVPGVLVDGNDIELMYETGKKAIERARKGEGPTLIEARTYRWKGHVGPDSDTHLGHRTEEELKKWQERCPIKLYTARLKEEGVIDDTFLKETKDAITAEIDEAFEFAKASPDVPLDELATNII